MKDGFYWVRWGPDAYPNSRRMPFIVEVYCNGEFVRHTYHEHREYFEQRAEFISKEPLTPPEAL